MGWLYTNTEYLPDGFTGTTEIHKNIMIIQNMREREKAFYNAMGFKDIHDLIAKFKALKDYDFTDLKLLRNCQESVGANNINLDSIIRNVTTKRDLDTNVPLTLTFNFSEAKKNTEEIRQRLVKAIDTIHASNDMFILDGDCGPGSTLTLSITPKWQVFKNLKLTDRNRQIDMARILQAAVKEGGLTVSQGETPATQSQLINSTFHQANYPWDLTPSVCEEMQAMGIDVVSDLREINTRICDAFVDHMNSPSGKVAQLFRQSFALITAKDPTFFQKGGNYMRGVKGAIGEVATEVILHMLYEAGGQNTAFETAIFGSERMEEGYEHPIDVLLHLGEEFFGIQSKNFAEQNQHRTYNTALLGSSLTMNEGENQSIINASFNLDAPKANSFGEIAQYVAANYGQQLLRLSFQHTGQDDLFKAGAGNQFFLIGGQYLVPGSVLLEYNLTSARGHGPVATMGNKDMNPTIGVGGDERPNPEFVKYWMSPEPFTATSYNATQYAAIGHRISFQFDFQMTTTNLQEYSLF